MNLAEKKISRIWQFSWSLIFFLSLLDLPVVTPSIRVADPISHPDPILQKKTGSGTDLKHLQSFIAIFLFGFRAWIQPSKEPDPQLYQVYRWAWLDIV